MPRLNLQQVFPAAFDLHMRGQLDQAAQLYRDILAEYPDLPDPLHLLGAIALQRHNRSDAIHLVRRAIAIDPTVANYHNTLGLALINHAYVREAIEPLQTAIRLAPDMAEAHLNLGHARLHLGQVELAMVSLLTSLNLKPNNAETYNNLADAHRLLGKFAQSTEYHRLAAALEPNSETRHSNLLYAMHLDSSFDGEAIFAEHRRFNAKHAQPLKKDIILHDNDRSPDRRLRVGYVSADLRQHAVPTFFESLLIAHDPKQVESFCFANVAYTDAHTVRFRQLAHQWHDLVGMTDERVTELIRRERIDILIDLNGHTSGNRLLTFARKPAPIQVTYLGYPNTTGLDAIDYRLTDAHADPIGLTDAINSEQLVRLPNTFLCFQPPTDAPPVSAAPVTHNGFVTFGSFNIVQKISDATIAMWAEILKRVERSRLLLKNLALDDPVVQRQITERFARQGVESNRLDFRGKTPTQAAHRELYSLIDIALDPFPYHGTTTTAELLWMGVPMITLAGQTHVSRVGVSLLTNVELQELIAQSPSEYVELAVQLANDRPRIEMLRSSLRPRMQNSPLTDQKRFARNVEAAYREMWRKWIQNTK